ncbi:MAG: radical SAM family heme chaperone HemW [Gammaproteobacteria bacterium]|nr:MAG: radical SAM family heme chaperone HemW [Gammaproteobacteria bacterium]
MAEFSTLPPLALYVHIPWCVRKCPYCDFNSHEADDALPEAQYIKTLLEDLEQDLPRVWGRRLTSLFIGGGTPSLFSPESLDQLLSGIRARLPCLPDMEITLEANPGTFEQARFTEYRSLGINRLSIGIQSFEDSKLSALGRIHNRREAIRAVETAHYAGFDNFNLDLMFGLPFQSPQQGMADLNTAIALEPTHLSWYQLTIEPNTFFYTRPPLLPDDELIWQLQLQGQLLLAEHGFTQYEVSAYARDGRQCKHNLNYWQFGDYLGIGAGAHGKLSRSDDHSIRRYWKLRQPAAYMNAAPDHKTSGEEFIDEASRVFEFMLNALRLKNGFDLSLFEQHTGLPRERLADGLNQAAQKDLLAISDQHVQPSELGYRFLNDVIALFET